MRDEPENYHAYLLRLWRVPYRGRWQWRAAIDCPHTGERHSFGTLAGLFTFLREKTHQETPENRPDRQDVDRGSVFNVEEERHDV